MKEVDKEEELYSFPSGYRDSALKLIIEALSFFSFSSTIFTDSQMDTHSDTASVGDIAPSIQAETEEYEILRHIMALIFQFAGLDEMIQYIPR